jgi:alkaline phosphatase D
MTIYDRTLAGMSRRELMKLGWLLGAAAIAPPLLTRRVFAKPVFDAFPFSLGVASGDPLPDGIVLWTRLAPKPLEGGGMPAVNVEVDWEIARDARFQAIAQKGTTLARPELGHSVHVEVGGLEPGRDYWYRFRAGDEISQIGRTRTAPPAGAAVDRLRFAVCGCNHYETGYFTAFRRIAEEQFDFVFHTGDYIYEGRGDGGRNDRVRQHTGQEIYTLVDYRNRYALYKSDRDLMAAHASAPWIMSWDDHEVDNNYAGDFDENGTPPEIFVLRRAAAYQAYYETMPLRASAMPSGSHMRLYRRLQFGNLVDLSVLDTRQWRSDQACGDGSHTNCAEALDPARTMMGTEQEKWLFDNLASVKSKWTVIGQQVYSFAFDRAKVDPQGALLDGQMGWLRCRAAAALQQTG